MLALAEETKVRQAFLSRMQVRQASGTIKEMADGRILKN
jgi:hypothetical protein